MNPDWINSHQSDIKKFALRNAVVTFAHPFDYCRTLMQLGYEPFQPVQATNLFLRTKYMGLPNVFTYLKYLKSVDGFMGCYRGLLPRLIESNVYFLVYNQLTDLFPRSTSDEEEIKDRSNSTWRQYNLRNRAFPNFIADCIPKDVRVFLKSLGYNVICQWVATTVAHPFHVLGVRAMAQFVGREVKYDNIFDGIREIYTNEGILGFFKGLPPRLIYDTMSIVVMGTCIFIFTKYVHEGNAQVTAFASGAIANSFAYPFMLVSTVMAVNNSGLALGSPPHAIIFSTWYNCWTTLRTHGQLGRGASMFARSFLGPVKIGKNWHPGDQFFGPNHPPGLGNVVLDLYPKTPL